MRTRDRRTAIARARQLDALLERTAAMDASGTVTAAQFAGLARNLMHSVLEAARAGRAGRAPDPVLPTGGEVEASLDPALADRIFDLILAAEDASADDDATAHHVGPVGRDGGPIYLPKNLAAPLITAL
ncbi:MAG TPA: hypothetical protein VIL69_13290 [Roseomonas sp.]